MIGIYLIGAFLISGVLFFNRNFVLNYLMIGAFVILQCVFFIYEYKHLNIEELGYFIPDSLAVIFLGVLSIVSIAAFYHSYIYFNHSEQNSPREQAIYYAAMVVLIASLSAAYLSSHIGVTWIFIDLTTLSASALIYHRRNIRTLEGTWKYLFVCSISLTLTFIGILFLTLALQEKGLKNLSYHAIFYHAAGLNTFWLKFAFLFIFTGYTAKAGLVPMYTAGIDAKDKSPSPAGALIGSVLMNGGFIGIYRLYESISHTSIYNWANSILILSGILSVFVAAIYILKVKNIKRLLAYSSVYHMGLVVIGLASGGIGRYAAILHLILHSFAKSVLFFQTGHIYRIYKSKSIYDIGNYFKYNLIGALVLLFAFFTVIAIPPSGMFISEFLIFRAVFENKNWITLALISILLTLIIWSFAKNIFKILFIKPVGFNEQNVPKIPAIESLSQFILLVLVIYLGLNPPVKLITLINSAIYYLP